MCDNAELDLRVVGGEQHVAVGGHERLADVAAALGAHRDVLQVRVEGAEPARGRNRLGKRRMDAPRFRVDELRQRVNVGGFQLRQLAPLQDQRHDRMLVGHLLEHLLASLILLALGQPGVLHEVHLLKENLP